jgi:hypothetical protein
MQFSKCFQTLYFAVAHHARPIFRVATAGLGSGKYWDVVRVVWIRCFTHDVSLHFVWMIGRCQPGRYWGRGLDAGVKPGMFDHLVCPYL